MDTIQKRLNELGIGNNPVPVKKEDFFIEYRLLSDGEKIKSDDEYYIKEAKGWMSVSIGWKECIGKKYKEGLDSWFFRREINYDIEKGEKAIELLEKLCDVYTLNNGFNRTVINEALDIISKWSWPGKKSKEKERCKILSGAFTGEEGEILNYFASQNGRRYVKVKLFGNVVSAVYSSIPESEVEIL